jgi:hypothetical protein
MALRHMGTWRSAPLIPNLDGGEWSPSHPCRFTSGEGAPGTQRTGGWVGPRASLDAVKKRLSCPCPELNPTAIGLQKVASGLILDITTVRRNYFIHTKKALYCTECCGILNSLLDKDSSPCTVLPPITGIRMKERETTVHVPTL